MIHTQPIIVPCLLGPSDRSSAGHVTQACLLEPFLLAMRTKDIDLFLSCSLKDKKEGLLGPFFSITWHQLSVGENRIKVGAAEMEEKGTRSIEDPVPILESPREALILVLCILILFFSAIS